MSYITIQYIDGYLFNKGRCYKSQWDAAASLKEFSSSSCKSYGNSRLTTCVGVGVSNQVHEVSGMRVAGSSKFFGVANCVQIVRAAGGA